MWPDLQDEAYSRATDRELPGGDALVLLAPGADLAAYKYRQMSALMGRVDVPQEETSGDPDPVLMVLAYWADEIRAERGELTDLPPTVERCAQYIRQHLDWAYSDQAEEFDAGGMLGDLGRLRSRMEAVLRAGYRPEMGVPCMYDECRGARIRRDIDHNGERTKWYCPECSREWDEDDYRLNVKAAAEAAQMEMIDGKLWATIRKAAELTRVSRTRIKVWAARKQIERKTKTGRPMFVSVDEIRERAERDKADA